MTEKRGVQKIEDWIRLSKADFHIHSNYSDGQATIEEILEYTQIHTDLNCLAITDHDTIEGALKAQKMAEKENYHFDVIVGEEVSTLEGHILALFIHKPIPAGLSAQETIKRIKIQGGLAIASHPFEHTKFKNPHMVTMTGIGGETLFELRHQLDGVEIVNATPTLRDENLKAATLNKTLLGLAETGSSDAHILEAIGKGYTLYEGETASDLKTALINHQTQAMYTRWTVLALIKYLFFFIPVGFRLLIYNLTHSI